MEHPSPPRPATPRRLRERVQQGETRASSGSPAPSSPGRDPAAGRERSRWLMLSLRRRQEEEGAGFRGMADDVELEDGEACSDDGGGGIGFVDPDVALSYIDEKLEHVLGHFWKDIEGGVSAEKLGPKLSGYGTFLPTYQRSPTPLPPSTRGSPMVANIASPRSPYQQPAEILDQNPSTVAVESISRNNDTTALSSGDICKEKICSSKNDDKDCCPV